MQTNAKNEAKWDMNFTQGKLRYLPIWFSLFKKKNIVDNVNKKDLYFKRKFFTLEFGKTT